MDDLLFFSKGNLSYVSALLDNFIIFSETSGLVANMRKSEIYFGGVKSEQRQLICGYTQLVEGKLPFRYLGIPLNGQRLAITQYQPLIERMLGKIQHWTS